MQDDVIVKPVGHSFNPDSGLVNLLLNSIEFQSVFVVFERVDSAGFARLPDHSEEGEKSGD